MAFAINTLVYAQRLRDAGFSAEQAEGQAEALAAAMTDTLATKQDLRELELRMDGKLEARFSQVEIRFAQIDARFAQMDARFEHFERHLERHLDTRLVEMEKRMEIRLSEQESRVALRLGEMENRIEARMDGRLADLERRLTVRLGAISVAGFGMVSALVTLLR